eukprot:Skav228076  [mRNA]  locus=scaffold5285:36239:39446:- [translate_table: standard]
MVSMPSIPSRGVFPKLLMFSWLVSLSQAQQRWPEKTEGWQKSWFSEGKPSWCQARPGSCVGRRQTYQEPIDIELVDENVLVVARIEEMKGFLDWDGDGDLDFFAAYVDQIHQPTDQWGIDYALGKRHFGFFERLGNNTFRKHQLLEACIDAVEADPSISFYTNVLRFEVADWDGDGSMDLLVATYVNESLTVRWANRSAAMGHGEVRQITIVADDLQPYSGEIIAKFLRKMKAVDWDFDGDTDLTWGARYFERVDPDTVVERVGDENPLNMLGPDMMGASEFSIDGDGHLKIILEVSEQDFKATRASYRSFKRAMDGTFVEQVEHPLQDLWVDGYYSVTSFLADWNSDGLLDLLLWDGEWGSSQRLTYYERTQEGDIAQDSHTTLYDDIEIDDSCWEMHLVDWNGDGFQDVLTYCRNQFQLYQFDGKKLLEVSKAFENVTCDQTCSIAMSDWDRDGDVDVILTSKSGHVHYHEMIDGRLHKEQIQHPLSSLHLIVKEYSVHWRERLFPQPLAVDWDNDGDVDLVLGPPDFRYFERLDNGSLSEWSREESPFFIAFSDDTYMAARVVAWRFLDCDFDGDLDLVRVQQTYSLGTSFHVCEHTDHHALRCDDHILCLGSNLSHFRSEGGPLGPHGRLFGWDFGTARHGQLEVLTVHKNRILQWRAGVCLPIDPCHQKGVCLHGKASCSCIEGYELADCSGCQPHFYSVDMSWGKAHGCEACPGEAGKVCHDRGLCFDDIAAKNASRMATAAQMARGNGSLENAFLVPRDSSLRLEVQLAAFATLEQVPAKQAVQNVSCVLLEHTHKQAVQSAFRALWGNSLVLEVQLAACAVLDRLPAKQAVRNVDCVLPEHTQKQAVLSALRVLQAQFQAQAVGTAAAALQVILPKPQWHVKHVQVELSPLKASVAAVLQVMCRVLQARRAQVARAF